MSDSDYVRNAIDHVRDAVAQIMADDEDNEEGPYMIGDLTLVAELTSEEGETHLFTLTSDEMTARKERGMLSFRLDRLTARSVVHELEDDD